MADLRPQTRNANRHTQRGMGQLEKSIQTDGFIGAITVAADDETFDGSARLEVLGAQFDGVEPIIVESDGTRPIVHRRIDIPSADDPRAIRLGLAANRVAQLNLDFDPVILEGIRAEMDLGNLWTGEEFGALLQQTPDFEPVGIEDQGRLDEKAQIECPHCHQWFTP